MDLKTKLAFALVSACLLSMGALGSFTYLWADEMFLEDSQRRLGARAESRRSELAAVFEGWERVVHGLVARSRLPGLLASHLDRPGDASSPAALDQLLEDARAAADGMRRLTVVDASGRRVAGDRPAGAQPVSSASDPSADVAYAGVRLEDGEEVGVVFRAPIVRDGQRLGVLEAVFDAIALEAVGGPTPDVGTTGATTVVVPIAEAGGSGARRAHVFLGAPHAGSATDEARAPAEVAAAALEGREEIFERVGDSRGVEVMAATRRLADAGFGIVVQVDRAEVEARAERLLEDMRDLGAAVAAFAILGGTLLGFRLARPIHRLVEEVDRIRHGEIGLRLDVEGEDEVAFLAMSLNEFLDQLDRSSDLFQLGELNILLVDGDAQSRNLLQDLFRNWNMRPVLAEDEAAALRAIEQADENDPFQLIVIDESTTDTDSATLVAALRSSSGRVCPIIVLSPPEEGVGRDAAAKTGVGRVLPKPVVASHLMEAILDEMGVSAEGIASTTDVYLKKATPRKILLADDSALIRKVMIGFLENWGHQVVSVENGRLAVERVRAEPFDLVLMDVEMPELNGLEAVAAIRTQEAEGEHLPIIALTAEAMTGDRERCLAAGMDDYLAKPADPKTLYARIQRCPARVLASSGVDPSKE